MNYNGISCDNSLFSGPQRVLSLTTLLAALLILVPTTETQARTIYKYVSPDGTIHLTDTRPRNQGYSKIHLKFPRHHVAAVSAEVKENVEKEVVGIATQYGLDARLVKAVATAESGYNPRAVSPSGAMGVMQLIPSTARRYSVDDPFDSRQNIEGGCKYLVDLLSMFDNDIPKTVAAYNAGENAVKKFEGIPPYDETQTYVAAVLRLYELYGGPRIEPPKPTRLTPLKTSSKAPSRRKVVRYIDTNGVIHLTNR